jgi:hypothetical protein
MSEEPMWGWGCAARERADEVKRLRAKPRAASEEHAGSAHIPKNLTAELD